MATSDSWTTIESDPGVFTELICKMGTKGVEVEELWSCDPDSLAALEPIYGLIFLFKWQNEHDDRPVDEDADARGVFFASQVINNACATQAIISILMNVPSDAPGFELGPDLTQLRDFIATFPADMRGLAIGNSDAIRSVHNSFHPPQPLVPDDINDDGKAGDAFHFVAFVPVAGGLYELDGLKPGPIRVCDCGSREEWILRASETLNARISRYSAEEQRFNLMAIVRSRLDMHEAALREARETVEKLHGQSDHASAVDRARAEALVQDLQAAVQAQKEKRRRWGEENLMRRTDYTPFIFQLLKGLAERNKLQGLIKAADEREREKR